MNSKLSFLGRAAAVAGIVALALPALAQTNPPAAAQSAPAPKAATIDTKAKKPHAAKKHGGMVKTAKSGTGHKPAPVSKPEVPASNAGK